MQAEDFLTEILTKKPSSDEIIMPDYFQIKQYKNQDVIEKFRTKFNIDEDEAQDLFNETIKYLYVAHIGHAKGQDISISESTSIIDEMWHTFVLFTKDYCNFCEKYFGRYLHHAPFTSRKGIALKEAKALNPDGLRDEVINGIKNQLTLIETHLGIETIQKWYIKYDAKYTVEKINQLRKPDAEIKGYLPISLEGIGVSKEELIGKITEHNAKIIIEGRKSCGCSGKGCGAGCSCNSRNSVDIGGGGGGGSSRVICTYFYKKGMLEREIWEADLKFTRNHLSSVTVRGYHAWAIPYVKLMRKSPLAEKVMFPLAFHRAKEIAYQTGAWHEGSVYGKIIRLVLEPACFVLGLIAKQKDWEELWNTPSIELRS